MIAEILHWYPGAVLADLAIKVGSDPYRHCFGIYEGDPEKYQCKLKEYLKEYKSGLYAPHLLLLKEKTHGILNYEDGEETEGEEKASCKGLCKLKISSFQEYENPDDLEGGEEKDSLEFPYFMKKVTKPTFSEEDQNLCRDSFKILYFHGGCNTSYSSSNEEDGVSAQLFLTLKKDDKGKFYYPEDVALAILRSMNRLATVAALQKLQEQQRQLEREAQMLRLLREPLEQLTSGLAQTTESAQRLRAVLWDPDKSIFSAASKVWLYFEQGAEPIVAGVPCKVEHNTDRYLDPKILGLTVLAIFSEIFGKDAKDAKNVSELWAWVRGDLTRNDDATAQLRDTCQKILYTPKNGWDVKDVKDWIWMHMDSYINSEKKWENNDSKCDRDKHIEKVLERLKLLLHEPYKFAPGNVSVLPIALILFGKTGLSKETAPLNIQRKGFPSYCKQFKDFEVVLKEEDLPKIFSGHNLPFPRVINLWTFVSRLVDQEASNGNLPKGTSIEICSYVTEIKLTFTKDLFKVDQNLVDRFQSLVGTKSSSSSLIGGDIMLPWLEFALSCEGKACGKANNEGGCVTIKNENGETFSIETKKDSLFVKAEKQ